jgi:DNA polymerase III sliding clamp (beta) subunit (PCNA family)
VLDSPGVDTPAALLVPGRGATEFARLFDGAKEGASLARLIRTADDRGLWLAHGDTALHARLIDGAFPTVDALVPQRWGTRVAVSADALRAALRLGALFGEGEQRPVLLDAAGGRLRLLTAEGEGGNGEMTLPGAEIEGADAALMIDAPLIARLLDAVPKAARLVLAWDGPGAALTIREQGRDPADLWLAMPLLLDAELHRRAVASREEVDDADEVRAAA